MWTWRLVGISLLQIFKLCWQNDRASILVNRLCHLQEHGVTLPAREAIRLRTRDWSLIDSWLGKTCRTWSCGIQCMWYRVHVVSDTCREWHQIKECLVRQTMLRMFSFQFREKVRAPLPRGLSFCATTLSWSNPGYCLMEWVFRLQNTLKFEALLLLDLPKFCLWCFAFSVKWYSCHRVWRRKDYEQSSSWKSPGIAVVAVLSRA